MMAALGIGALAGASGFSFWRAYEARRRVQRHHAALGQAIQASEGMIGSEAPRRGVTSSTTGSFVHDAIVEHMVRTSRDVSLGKGLRLWRKAPRARGAAGDDADVSAKGRAATRHAAGRAGAPHARRAWFEANAPLAGVLGDVTAEGFAEVRARLALGFGAFGFLVGLLFSTELALVLGLVGGYLGWRAPAQALVARIRWRAHETERHLPEMLNVVALGMRSGLSFDTSLRLYAEHFDTVLARELANVQRQWTSGLMRRDEALRKVAATYDSAIFARVVETIIRSIRYGSSMVQSLESDAAEARSSYQAERQERIAKAPVKMMIPTGVLILPAMLVLVMGPVLLELMGGGL